MARKCENCGDTIRRSDPAIMAFGLVFCSDDCVDDYSEYGPPLDGPVVDVVEGVDVYGALS